ncbi:cobalt-precorrin 5A hydrolase [Aminipila butyrica]|uniref:Cobalt-precorrin 5A hydrolase n=1 Tax=Aminipila butyrica TaxID=433296 RepID=A0A858BZH9_9FIRM|nr:cobalt-precorrin 5A hydrolase [Aminipila butyrica]QIB69496.1 cobalt-precorrin 5A hydrolase [Aminipila butyrica]
MRIALISFTEKGGTICKLIAEKLSLQGEMCLAYGTKDRAADQGLIPLDKPLTKWAKEAFETSQALVFVGATGIAVRAIAPYLKGKDQDPAVIAVDERGQYVISLLSGHLGGANRLASVIADEIEATPVITTATDINKRFAVDVWAQSQQLSIVNLKAAKQVSADILNGKTVYFYWEGRLEGSLPKGLELVDAVTLKSKIHGGETCIVVTEKVLDSLKGRDRFVLQLVPKNISIGMGCKKNTPFKAASELLEQTISQLNIRREAICGLASIDLKKDEKALIRLAEKLQVPFITYSGETLMEIQGEFTSSSFVRQVTGVENVCERAALAGSGGSFLLRKQSLNGVTIAGVRRDVVLKFTESDV